MRPLSTLSRILRGLMASPRFVLPSLLVLSLGIGAAIAVFGVLRATLLRPLPFDHPERVHVIYGAPRQASEGRSRLPFALNPFRDLTQRLSGSEAESVAGFVPFRANLQVDGEPDLVPVSEVSRDFFRVVPLQPVLGRMEVSEDGARGIVLSEPYWRQRFRGEASVLGRTVVVDGEAHPVVGVAPAAFSFYGACAFVPLKARPTMGNYIMVLARLRSGASLAAFRQRLDALHAGLAYPELRERVVRTESLDAHLRGKTRDLNLMVSGVAGLLVLIAALNLSVQCLLRAMDRRQDMAIRTALGALPRQAMGDGLLETLVLGIFGALLGLGVGQIGLVALAPMVPADLRALAPLTLDGTLLLLALGLAFLLSLVAALMPGFVLHRLDLVRQIRQGGRGQAGSASPWGRRLLVTVQVALALSLLGGFGVMARTLVAMSRVDMGFRPEGLTALQIQPREEDRATMDAAITRAMSRLQTVPGVSGVATCSLVPRVDHGQNYTPLLRNQVLPEHVLVEYRKASPSFFEVMGTRMLQGRTFEDGEMARDLPVAVLSRAAAERCFPGQDPLGRDICDPDDKTWLRVVGICEDVLWGDPAVGNRMTVYRPGMARGRGVALLVRGSRALVPDTLKAALRSELPQVPMKGPEAMTALASKELDGTRALVQLLGVAGGMAFLLALVGVYGAMGHQVHARRKEFGVRLALGAHPLSVVRLVLAEGLLVSCLGVGGGLALCAVLTRGVEGLAFGIKATDPQSLLGAAALMVLGSILAGLPAVWRASSIPPLDAMRP